MIWVMLAPRGEQETRRRGRVSRQSEENATLMFGVAEATHETVGRFTLAAKKRPASARAS
jgi:hypothetical protein